MLRKAFNEYRITFKVELRRMLYLLEREVVADELLSGGDGLASGRVLEVLGVHGACQRESGTEDV